jgi:hypothetical protein
VNGRGRLEELSDDATRFGLLEIATDFQYQRRVGNDLRFASDEQRHRDQAHRRDRNRQNDENEYDPDASSDSHVRLLLSSIAA